jgi:hypothetical protein
MTNTISSTPTPAQIKLLKSPMRDLVRAELFFRHGGEASLDALRSRIDYKFDAGELPRNWRLQVRDVLKLDPDIEKTEDNTWVLRIKDDSEA